MSERSLDGSHRGEFALHLPLAVDHLPAEAGFHASPESELADSLPRARSLWVMHGHRSESLILGPVARVWEATHHSEIRARFQSYALCGPEIGVSSLLAVNDTVALVCQSVAASSAWA